ncbi:MAG: beta-N-acetylhexosaminidase [Alphaproteobacteria bacterium]|nr:beta-N-acetylhexosaminidase [Alphaproteobacteria bacterium]MBV9373322.1 beta-N-acetylhexosaminidase [Alphaproteobacteria bacterium]MBV9900313.1 beta-N-acetylhexosaminidase [Alphaproteobacteria bacterium]
MQAAIYGLSGPDLTPGERDFFRDADPAGYILFARNCVSRPQMRALTDALRALAGRDDLPILIDQEGGRVARMKPPEWPRFPAAEAFARLYEIAPMSAIEAARANAGAIALQLREVGVNVDCLPVLDVRQPGATDIVGDRALGGEPMQVAALGRAVLDGLEAGGVVGVVKHIPGHGRALVDSHEKLPVVRAPEEALAVDIEPFRSLAGAPMAMTAHLVYTAWDGERPASQSPVVIEEIVRGRIGFDGFLMSDDMGMHALSGGFDARARLILDAGNDAVLHCSGDMGEMVAVASAVGALEGKGAERLSRAMATVAGIDPAGDYATLAEKRDRLLALA